MFDKIDWLYKYLVMGYLVGSISKIKKLIEDERFVAICFISYISLLVIDYIWFTPLAPFAKGIAQSICGIITFVAISRNLAEKNNKISKGLAYLGKESLPIYLTHYFFLPFFPWMNKFLTETISNKTMIITWEFWVGILGVIMTLVPTLLVIRIIKSNKYLAFLIYGEKIK